MKNDGPLLPRPKHVPEVRSKEADDGSAPVVCTRDHDVIKRWAHARRAEPATGESTATGPATPMTVNDTGAGVRFNFPGVGKFRPITWAEWFELFDQHELAFVYENDATHGPPSARYQLIKFADWKGIVD